MKKIFLLFIIILSVSMTGSVFAFIDNDQDTVRDYDENTRCLNTASGATVTLSGTYIGCSVSQKNAIVRDLDGDGVRNDNGDDQCPHTPKGAPLVQDVNYKGCTTEQKAIKIRDRDFDGVLNDNDAFPDDATEWRNTDGDALGDNADTDDDNDGLEDSFETGTGWTVRIPIEKDITADYNFTTLEVTSEPLKKDTDGDGLTDKQEMEKGLNPRQKDTDGDGVRDDIDTEITHSNGKLTVNAQGKFTPGAVAIQDPNTIDTDKDSVPDVQDKCPNTPANKIVEETGEAKGCSAEQKSIDSDGDDTPDYRDNDSDNDGLSDTIELTGWQIQIPIALNPLVSIDNFLTFTGSSDTRMVDTDGDGLNDRIEKQKGLNPQDTDTDRDGVTDDIDTEITASEGRLYVDAQGVYQESIYNNADEDGDGIKNNADLCPGSPSGSDVYKDGLSLGCTPSQRTQKSLDSDFDGVPDIRDICSGTPASLRKSVGINGCPVAESMVKSYTMFSVAGSANNVSIGGSAGSEGRNVRANDKLMDFNENNQFIKVTAGGEGGIYNTLLRLARDIKNLFYVISTIFFLIITIRLILATNTDEEVEKFKKGIIWITIGIIVMQIAYAFAVLTFDKGVSARLGASIIENIVYPLIALLQTLASLFFIAMAIYAFYRLVTADGNEEAVKSGRMTVVYAFIGFLIVYFARAIVEAFYGHISCESFSLGFITIQGEQCTNTLDITEGSDIIIKIINWFNGFVAIIVLIMILYAGAQILLSQGDEEKVKKGKQSLLYIAIGLLILVANYLILTFFLVPETASGVI